MFFAPERIVVCEASTKAGKTIGALIWLMALCFEDRDGATRLWLAPIYPQAKIAFDRLVRKMTECDPGRRVWECNRSELWVRLGKAKIVFRGGDEPDSIYGYDYADAVIDEASRCKEAAWYAVRSTLTATKGKVRIIGNVKGRKNWAFRMARKAQSGERDMAYFKLTVHDAIEGGVLTHEDLADAKRDLPEDVFKELYLAEPTEDGSNPFGLQHIAACVADESSDTPVAFGCDLAESVDWTVLIGLDAKGRTADFDRWQGIGWDATENRIVSTVGRVPIAVDETGVGKPVTERLQRRCPGFEQVEGFTFSSRSKQQLMAQLAVAIQQRRVSFPDGPIRAELESFEFEHTPSGVRYKAPDGSHDDCVCALALAVLKLDKVCNAPRASLEWADTRENGKMVDVRMAFAEKRKDQNWGFDSDE